MSNKKTISWTAAQQDAIDAREGPLLVSAAAGSGKTAVLVERIIDMITDPKHPIDADRFLVVTYTRAAAGEMKERIGARLEELLKNGGFFCSFKLRDNNDYHKSFMVRHSYLEKFKLGGEIKTFIFDATADISEMYPTGAEWLNVDSVVDGNIVSAQVPSSLPAYMKDYIRVLNGQ